MGWTLSPHLLASARPRTLCWVLNTPPSLGDCPQPSFLNHLCNMQGQSPGLEVTLPDPAPGLDL